MNEEFLHYVWKFQLFNQQQLTANKGESLDIIKSGSHNTDAGPDFFNARIRLNTTEWAGNIEIHVNASDWKKHNHQHDKAYSNVILHVVYEADEIIYRNTGEPIPTLELKERISQKIYNHYLQFKGSKDWIPCQKQIEKVPVLVVNSTLDRLLLERLERKASTITDSLKLNNNNWEETFYRHLARNFGFKTNAEPFELLAKFLPLSYLGKHKNNLLQIEALLFGQAGLLEQHFNDKYLQTLQNEYVFLKHKFNLTPVAAHLWKFLRLRPANFPTIRIAQFAGLVFNATHLFSKILETEKLEHLKKLINTDVSDYWQSHYTFDKLSLAKSKQIGEEALNNILINTVVPFLFVYGKSKNEEKYIDRAIQFLEQIQGENNAIIKNFKTLKLPVKTAHSTQALLQLKNEYCTNKKCLHCSIGNYLLKNA